MLVESKRDDHKLKKINYNGAVVSHLFMSQIISIMYTSILDKKITSNKTRSLCIPLFFYPLRVLSEFLL